MAAAATLSRDPVAPVLPRRSAGPSREAIAVFAHDLNNLLGVILAASEALETRLPAEAQEARELARLCQSAAETGSGLVARLQGGAGREAEVASARVAGVLATVAAAIRVSAPQVQVAVAPCDVELAAQVHGADLESALLNLAVNAAHAMPDGGRLSFSARRHEAGVRLEVTDTGVGMSPELLARVTQTGVTTRRGQGGQGLGLAAVSAFARDACGGLTLRSQPGQGTTAVLDLPRA